MFVIQSATTTKHKIWLPICNECRQLIVFFHLDLLSYIIQNYLFRKIHGSIWSNAVGQVLLSFETIMNKCIQFSSRYFVSAPLSTIQFLGHFGHFQALVFLQHTMIRCCGNLVLIQFISRLANEPNAASNEMHSQCGSNSTKRRYTYLITLRLI